MKEEMKCKNMDSFCYLLFGINDENELIYSRYDIDYVIDLLKTNKSNTTSQKQSKQQRTASKHPHSACHTCTGTALFPPTPAPGLGLAPATSAPGLGLTPATSAPDCAVLW